ncbi:MAG: hypothetical protein LBJ74_02055 [Heliobacteriaceae bacterium]|jgi:hypothetical protein|nr:hypothetical protein [Heliobacteriaceae bacterium]
MFKKLAQKLNTQKGRNITAGAAINPINVDFNSRKSVLNVLNLYEKECDIKNFSKLALSNPENNSHEDIMSKLFSTGVPDIFEDDKLVKLADNSQFLRDLGFTD